MDSPEGPAGVRQAAPGANLRYTLLVGALMLFWVLGGLAVVAYQDHQRQVQGARDHNVLLARLFADHVTRNIEAASAAVATLGKLMLGGMPAEDGAFQTAMQQTLVNLPYLRGIAVIDAQGLVLASTDPGETGLVLDLRSLGNMPTAFDDRLGPLVNRRGLVDLAAGMTTPPTPAGVGFLPMLRRVQMADNRKLWLIALINAEAFANFQQATMGQDDGRASALLSLDGRLITGTGRLPTDIGADLSGTAPFTQFLPRFEQGDWIGKGLQPGDQVAAFRMSATRPIVVVVEESLDQVRDRWLGGLRGLGLAGLAATLVIGSMTVLAWRSQRARAAAAAERDSAQRIVAKREQELSVTMKSVQEVIFRTNAEGRLTFANERWSGFTGRAAGGIGGSLWEAAIPADQPAVRALFGLDADTGVRRAQAVLRDSDERERCVEIAVIPLQQTGQLIGFAGSAVDVTERELARRQLQAQLAFIEQLMDTSPLPMSVMSEHRQYVLVNRAWEEFTGLSRQVVVDSRVGAHLARSEQEVHEERDRELLDGGRPLRYETRALHRDGSVRDIVVNKLLLPQEPGQPRRIMAVLEDVTEFRNAERATREAQAAAEEASRSKSEFVANISHELRTPLQSIIGFSELGRMRGQDQPRLATMFTDIHDAGQRMLRLVNDLLDVAKIESLVGTMHLERTDLRGLLHGVAREFDPLLSAKRLKIDLDLPTSSLTARVDPSRFQQVVRNVLANAVKFSPPGGSIVLGGETADSGEPLVWVDDQGPGIPEAELEQIFEAFVQSSRTKDGSGGTGLGLAICRKILQAHGGWIRATNLPGGGASFRIGLPGRGQAETQPASL
jgi:PAS domain S-box-containing protein